MQNNFYIIDQSSADVVCKYRILMLKSRKHSRANAHKLQSETCCLVQRKFRILWMRIWFGFKYFDSCDDAIIYLEQKDIPRLERRGPRPDSMAAPEEQTRSNFPSSP